MRSTLTFARYTVRSAALRQTWRSFSNAPMACFQCEQTSTTGNIFAGRGCTTLGNCGKTPEVSREQDLLMHALKGISQYTARAAKLGARDADIDRFTADAAFTTLTNVNFDSDRFVEYLKKADAMIARAKTLYETAYKKQNGGKSAPALTGPAEWRLKHSDAAGMVEEAKMAGDILDRKAMYGEDVVGMQEMILYGIKGQAAYADHAMRLGQESEAVFGGMRDSLAFLGDQPNPSMEQLVQEALKVGDTTISTLKLLSDAHASKYGNPVPTKVPTQPRVGKAILISGHDLVDLEELLKQTEGKGIDVYTHGEMLPGHAYPGLKKYKHLYGNYGGAWQLQQVEFATFQGPIVMTSNCIIEPRKSYKDRVFTTNAAGWPGVKHLEPNKAGKLDFSAVIEKALAMPGFTTPAKSESYVLTGFGHTAVLGVADKVIDAVKAGAIKHFFLIGGCDGAEGERSYFRDLATAAPKDSVILTLACGKYRFNKLQQEFGDIGGIPRVLDMGQCNDAYSAVVVAMALKDAFGLKSINDLPLSYAISWFEQKAVAVLLALLKLGVKNIRLGPKTPAFATPAMLSFLQKEFNLQLIGNVNNDLKNMLAKQ